MKQVNAAIVHSILEKHQASGLHVDCRLWEEINAPGEMFLCTLGTKEEFLILVWQAIPQTYPLAPIGMPRTLRDCAERLSIYGWDFRHLIQEGFDWFGPCVSIDNGFDYGEMGLIALTLLNESERRETPAGSYYIYDGAHKSIVLAKRLLRGETEYQPVQILLLTPRRS